MSRYGRGQTREDIIACARLPLQPSAGYGRVVVLKGREEDGSGGSGSRVGEVGNGGEGNEGSTGGGRSC